MTDRISCSVPFCRKTRGLEPGKTYFTTEPEWICADHWRAVPRTDRAIYHRARRKHKQDNALARLWARVKRTAIERAGGI